MPEFNIYDVVAAVAAAYPEREAVVQDQRRRTFGEFIARANAVANALLAAGLTVSRERAGLESQESGQAHAALYMRNSAEHAESLIACFGARVMPVNVNFRYVADELAYLLNDARVEAIVVQSEFAPVLQDVLPHLLVVPRLLMQVPDDSGHPLLPGARWYEDVIASHSTNTPLVDRSPNDLYGLYTGGTTGMPKGVLWRQADAFVPLFGGRRPDNTEWTSLAEIVAGATGNQRICPAAPMMRAAGQWPAVRSLTGGHTLVLPGSAPSFDAADYARLLEDERVTNTNVVGDAFIVPFLAELDRRPRAFPHLRRLASGGVSTSLRVKQGLLARIPHISAYETSGASETGAVLAHESFAAGVIEVGVFRLLSTGCVLSADQTRVLEPGSGEIGWLAAKGRVPLGYLGDAEKSAATFPVIDGVRRSIPGDRVTYHADGVVEFHGRESGTINTGGEKVFPFEVEHVLLQHDAIRDVVVVGRPNGRWGTEVVALVEMETDADDADMQSHVRARLAAYKAPRAFIRVPLIVRGPNGKIDYRWAKDVATRAG